MNWKRNDHLLDPSDRAFISRNQEKETDWTPESHGPADMRGHNPAERIRFLDCLQAGLKIRSGGRKKYWLDMPRWDALSIADRPALVSWLPKQSESVTYSEQLMANLVFLHDLGLTKAEIADITGLPRRTVYRNFERVRNGTTPRFKSPSLEGNILTHLSPKYANWIAERFKAFEAMSTARIEALLPHIRSLITTDQWQLVIKLGEKALDTKEKGKNPITGEIEVIPPVIWVAIELASLPLQTQTFKALILNLAMGATLADRVPKGEGQFAKLVKEQGL